jgi:pSer/pThr/pTyr-binding forkhead associated (FHA) protein
MAHLIIEQGDNVGTKVDIGSDAVVIGRLQSNAVTIKDPKLSRENTKVFRKDKNYCVADLGSRNGTLVNGKKISSARVLNDGDRIQIGETVIRFRDPSAPSRPPQKSAPSRPVKAKTSAPEKGSAMSTVGTLALIVYFALAVYVTKLAADQFLPKFLH